MKELENFIMSVVDGLGSHPIVGSVISLFSALMAFVLNRMPVENVELNYTIKDILQISAWICSILVSLLTIFGFIRKEIKDYKNNKKLKSHEKQ